MYSIEVVSTPAGWFGFAIDLQSGNCELHCGPYSLHTLAKARVQDWIDSRLNAAQGVYDADGYGEESLDYKFEAIRASHANDADFMKQLCIWLSKVDLGTSFK
jgi:hypothetical protein